MVEKVKKDIASNPKVLFLHLSLDSSEKAATNWAAKEQFPWLTVLPGDVKRSGLSDYHTSRSVPFYTLLDGNGKSLATGSSAVFREAIRLTKG